MQTSLCPKDLAQGLLSQEQTRTLSKLLDEIREAEGNYVIWRTFTEAAFSVLNDVKFPTPASKYHQAIREQLVFYDQLVVLSFDFREKEIDLAETLEQLETAEGHEKQRLEVKRDRLQYEIEGIKRQAKDRIRELEMWSGIKDQIVANSPDFDTRNKDTDELIALTIRFCREALLVEKSNCTDPGAIINIISQATSYLTECKRRGIVGQLPSECHKVLREQAHKKLGRFDEH